MTVHQGDPVSFRAPAYIAQRIFVGANLAKRTAADPVLLPALYGSLRPYGGVMQFLNQPSDAPPLNAALAGARLMGSEVDASAQGVACGDPGRCRDLPTGRISMAISRTA